MKVRWRRRNTASVGTFYEVDNSAGQVIIHIHRKDHCGYWYVFVGEDMDEADGDRFNFLWEAKRYAEKEIKSGRVTI